MADYIDRQAAKKKLRDNLTYMLTYGVAGCTTLLDEVPSVQPTLYGYNIEHLAYIARVMQKEGISAEDAVRTFDDIGRAIKMIADEAREIAERSIFNGFDDYRKEK